MHPGQVQHQQEVFAAYVQEGFRAADLGDFHGHCQLQVIIVARHQADMAGTHAKAKLAFADGPQVDVQREVHEVGEAHFIATDAPGHQVDRRLGKQLGRQHGLRLVIDLGGLAALDHPALVENRGGTAQGQGFVGFGGGVDGDGVTRLEQLAHFLAQFFAQFVVQVHQGLIEQNQLGILDQRPGHGGALLLAAGEFQGVTLEEFLDAQHFRGFEDFALDLLGRDSGLAQRRGDVLEHGHGRVVDELLIDHRHIAQAHRLLGDVHAIHQDAPAVRLVQAGHQAHQAGLAGERAAQQYIEGTGFETQVGVVDPGLAFDNASDVLQGQ